MSEIQKATTVLLNQSEIDKEQMIAGAKLAQEMLKVASLSEKPLTQEMKEKLMKDVKMLYIPERYKDLSAKDLREMLMHEYIRDASVGMLENFKARCLMVKIRKEDEDLVKELLDHWEEKGIKASITDDRKGTDITLQW